MSDREQRRICESMSVLPDPGTVVHVGRTGLHGTVRAHAIADGVSLVLVEYDGPCTIPIVEGNDEERRIVVDIGDSEQVYEQAHDLTIVGGERS